MTLNEYLSIPDALTLTALSVECEVSKGRLSQIRSADDCPPDLALKLERVTAGQICASEISSTIRKARQPVAQQEAA
jgi:hypothetical protein